jgi:hypothetical protein
VRSDQTPTSLNGHIGAYPVRGRMSVLLLTLPLELRLYLSAYLHPSSIAALQRTSRRTKQMTEERLLYLSATLPSPREVLVYLRDGLVRNTPLNVALLPLTVTEGAFHLSVRVHRGHYFVYRPVSHVYTAVRSVYQDVSIVGESALLTLLSEHHVDPTTLLRTLRRRLGCVRRHRLTYPHTAPAYGMDVVIAYARTVLYPRLSPLVADRRRLATIPLERPDRDRKLETLQDAVFGWARHHDPERVLPTDTDAYLDTALMPCLVECASVEPVLTATLTSEESPSMEPTTSQVLSYVQERLSQGHGLRMSFYAEALTPTDTSFPESACHEHSTYVLDMEDAGSGTYVRYGAGHLSTSMEVQSGPEALLRLYGERTLPGTLDPASTKRVIEWACQRRIEEAVRRESRLDSLPASANPDMYGLRWTVLERAGAQVLDGYEWERLLLPALEYLRLSLKSVRSLTDATIRERVSTDRITPYTSWRLALYCLWCTGNVDAWCEATSLLGVEERKALAVRCTVAIVRTCRQMLERT